MTDRADNRALSQRQRNILVFTARHILARGYAPTIRDIGAATNISSPSLVRHHLRVLEKFGYIARAEGVARGLKILKWPAEA